MGIDNDEHSLWSLFNLDMLKSIQESNLYKKKKKIIVFREL